MLAQAKIVQPARAREKPAGDRISSPGRGSGIHARGNSRCASTAAGAAAANACARRNR